jgi:hypothetical protein
MRRRAGWVFIDVLTGIILVGALAIILTAGARRQERGIHRLADTRAAYRLAESTLISLQGGQSPTMPDDSRLLIHELSPCAEKPGMSWAEVQTTINGQQAGVIGVIPKNALEKAR